MPSRSLPGHPDTSAPHAREPATPRHRRWPWRALLATAGALLAAVVMAQAIMRIRNERTVSLPASPTATHAAVPAADSAEPSALAPAASPARPARAVPMAQAVRRAAPDAKAAVTPPPESLAWMHQDLPCEAGADPCKPSRVLALVDAKKAMSPAHPPASTPTPAVFGVRALAAVTLAPHPRLLLDGTTLAALRQRATASNPQWTALKAKCDSYIGGTVEYPTGNAYPDLPNLGQGYQGSDYVPALLAEGMCYQVLKTSNASAAASYGAKAVDILMKMSASGSQGQPPCTDSGYGMRFYGVGMGLGYDWVYDLLTPTQRTQVYTTANAWLTAWEAANGCADFEYAHPQSNYYAGYFHAKAAIALATYDENPSAPAEWDDWLNNQFAKRVQPYYQQHLLGGGWPEGYANYAPLGIFNMTLPLREVKTATGQDLVHAAAPYSYPLDSAEYAMHFTWPSRTYFDDRDTNHSDSNSQPPGTTQVGLFQQLLGALAYWGSPHTAIFRQYLADVDAATSGYGYADEWLRFLSLDPAGTTAPVSGLPLSYFAPGLGAVAARSDWGSGAAWMSFRAAPYANNPEQGEEYFDQGSLALVRGGTPLLLNATGWLVHNPNGTTDENLVYTDNFGSFSSGNVYSGNRQIYNIFYVRNLSNGAPAEQYGQFDSTTESNQASTRVAAFEDGSSYVYVLATGLQDMYRSFAAGPAVTNWSREIVYLRPDRFVVYDRTTAGSASYDQYLAWHFPANPTGSTTGSGGNRLDVSYGGNYAGAMITVLPQNATLSTTAMYPSSNPAKAWQVQVRSPVAGASQQWLTVFDLSTASSTVASAKPVTVVQGGILGVQLAATDGSAVVVSSTGAAGTPLSGAIGYTVDNYAALHVITDLAPSTGYTVSVATSGNQQTITVTPGGSTTSSVHGVLSFTVNGNSVQPTTLRPPPVSNLPVSGYPRPYTG
ncbi:MAG TPA: hypothetical protein VJR95_00175 [Rhodanobacter sp.]|nr:hypothetical protein [Rhodanobacter sp.]